MSFPKRVLALQPKSLLSWCRILCILLAFSAASVEGIRAKRSSFLDDDTTIRTEYVDRNNRTILALFNLTEAQMNRIYAANGAKDKDPSTPPRDSQYFNSIKEYRLNDIMNRLQSAFQTSNSEESQELPQHEMAAYPMCNSESNESSWQQDNNITIRFSHSLFEPKHEHLSLDSAILRLYKVNPNGSDDPNDESIDNTKPKRCIDPLLDSQIRITVSIVQQLRRNKRERKKRICNTIMMNVSKTGWVEIDIKRAIYIWENVERQQNLQQLQQTRQPTLVGFLMIEVHDEEERPLKPGLFFKPPKCDQADLAVPWNYYRPDTSMSTFAAHEVPRYPRLDLKLIGYASFPPKNYNKDQFDKLRENLRRQLFNAPKNPAENAAENEFTTSITPTADNLLDTSASTRSHRKRHSRRHHHPHQHDQQKYNDSKKSAEIVDEALQQLRAQQHLEHAHRHRRQHSHHEQHVADNVDEVAQYTVEC